MKTIRLILAVIACTLTLSSCGNRKAKSVEEYVIEKDPIYNVPTEELLKRFPIRYQTPASTPQEKGIQNRMLNGFGTSAWSGWVDRSYASDVTYDWNGTVLDLGGAKELNARVSAEVTAKKVRIDNIIVSEDWAGVHAWMSVHRPDGSADAFDTMAFYHFVEGGDGTLKVDKCWIKENVREIVVQH